MKKNPLSEPSHKSSKTGTEIVYKPDPDIDIEEFKQEPMNEMIHEMISSLSSAPDSLDNETLNSEFWNVPDTGGKADSISRPNCLTDLRLRPQLFSFA